VIVDDIAQTEANQVGVVNAVEEDVVHLEIGMDNLLLLMQIGKNGDDLNKDKAERGLVPSSASSISS
jgi:hypothetical protein